MTFDEFQETRRLGCPEDYELFSPGLDPLLEQIHDRLEHSGKVPSGVNDAVEIEHEIQKKEHALQTAVNEEEFERAAELRDEIDELKQKHASLTEDDMLKEDEEQEEGETNKKTEEDSEDTGKKGS
jgi:protein arginine kinase activator